MRIPLFKPHVGFQEYIAVLRVMRSGVLSRGNEVKKFEEEFSSYVGKKYAVSINSGTSALHVLVRALGWKKGDEVITTAFSYVASANSLLFESVTPVFVDIDPITLNIDPSKIEEKITERTKGILLVHIFGLPADHDKIGALKEKYNLQVIEDACEALGRPSAEFTVGKLGEGTVYGFHQNKQLTTGGEGGMITTDDSNLAMMCRSLRDQGRSEKEDWLKNVILGFNLRMTELQAAFGRAQLARIDRILRKRERIATEFSRLLQDLDTVSLPHLEKKRSWFFFYISLLNPDRREALARFLKEKGIDSGTNYFPPIYSFPMYEHLKVGALPVTERVSKSLLILPTFDQMSNRQIVRVTNAIREFFKK